MVRRETGETKWKCGRERRRGGEGVRGRVEARLPMIKRVSCACHLSAIHSYGE